ncbi:MAG: hypothetical protein V4632_08520 [Pseudomonadota bacterium]
MNEKEHKAQLTQQRQAYEDFQAGLPEVRVEGGAALTRLLKIVFDDNGQSRLVAGFLLGLYDGARFKVNLNALRALQTDVFDDCMKVLRMDYTPYKKVHEYFENGAALFEQMAADWGTPDRTDM